MRVVLEANRVFYGHSTVAIDAKGRTNLPRELRRELPSAAEGKVVIVPGPKGTLLLFDAPSFERLLRSLQARERTQELAASIRRMTAMAASSELDEQNRLSIPPRLMEWASLEGRVTFVGEGDRVSLMPPSRFETEVLGTGAPDFDGFLDTLQVPQEAR
jgi:MraZ protein